MRHLARWAAVLCSTAVLLAVPLLDQDHADAAAGSGERVVAVVAADNSTWG